MKLSDVTGGMKKKGAFGTFISQTYLEITEEAVLSLYNKILWQFSRTVAALCTGPPLNNVEAYIEDKDLIEHRVQPGL